MGVRRSRGTRLSARGVPLAERRSASDARGTAARDVGETVLRLAVLLQAGASPSAAWRHLGEVGDEAAAAVCARADAGLPLTEAIEAQGSASRPPRVRAPSTTDRAPVPRGRAGRGARPEDDARTAAAWRDVAAAWEVSIAVGAPLAGSLRGMSRALRDARESGDDVRVALAEPTATARLMGWLPLFGLAIGGALGFDTLRVLLTTAFGAVCLAGGVLLICLSRWWTGRLVRSAGPPPGTPGMTAELLAIALSGGVSIPRALGLVHDAPGGPRPVAGIEEVLDLSRSAGVPAVELLRAAADHERHDARTAGRLAAARLGSRLLLPLGACTLPAFILLGVAPMMLAVIVQTPLPGYAE